MNLRYLSIYCSVLGYHGVELESVSVVVSVGKPVWIFLGVVLVVCHGVGVEENLSLSHT